MKLKSNVLFLILGSILSIIGTGCKKDAGEGGTSTIYGRVVVHDFDVAFQDSAPSVIYYPSNEDVYIIYGTDHSTYDNDYKSSFNGGFEFKYLQKGHYKIFAYSKDSTGAYNGTFNANRPKIPVFAEVEITSNGSTVTVPDLIILKNNQ